MRSSNSQSNAKTSRYKVGVVNYFHKGKTITSTLGSEEFDNYIGSLQEGEFQLGRIPAGYEARPDLISNLFMGNTDHMWKLLLINNIPDPFEGLKVGQQILLPK